MLKVYTQQVLDSELKKNKKVLALFYSAWCPYCVRFVPTFDKIVSIMGFERVIHVLLDDYDNPFWDHYDIPAVPTIILFENSKVSRRLDGQLGSGLSEQAFKTWISELK